MRVSKSLRLLFTLAAIFSLAACSAGESHGKLQCSQDVEICINLQLPQSFSLEDAVPVTQEVTASQDIADLHVAFMPSSGSVQLDGPDTWESNAMNAKYDGISAFWDFSIKAGETITFRRIMHLPEQDGYYTITVNVATYGRVIEASGIANIHVHKERGKVYRSGTKVPKIQPEITAPVYGPGTPSPTWVIYPSDTPYPPTESPDNVTPLLGPLEGDGGAYPPPVTPLPTATVGAYP